MKALEEKGGYDKYLQDILREEESQIIGRHIDAAQLPDAREDALKILTEKYQDQEIPEHVRAEVEEMIKKRLESEKVRISKDVSPPKEVPKEIPKEGGE